MAGETYPTTPLMVKDSAGNFQVSHAWQRFLQGQWRKTGQASDNAPINSLNITGILASLNLANNSQVNTTNFCTVDSVDNGVDATIRVYGSGGVGTTWTRQVGNVTLGPYPSLSQAGNDYDSDYFVMFNPDSSQFVVTKSFVEILPDGYIWCGQPHTVQSGGGGGTSGGGGDDGGGGGVCFSGNTRVKTSYGPKRFYEMEFRPTLITEFGPREAKLIISPYEGELVNIGGNQWATPRHPFKRDGLWIPAEDLFSERRYFSGHVYNAHIETDKDEERHYILENGEVVHNLSILG